MFTTTYSKANPNFKELFSKHWSYLDRSSATRELGKQNFMITYRKLPSLKNILGRERIIHHTTALIKVLRDQNLVNIVQKSPNEGELKFE